MLKDMKAYAHLKPGQNGTLRLQKKYGNALLCVRYRYDEVRCRNKTIGQILYYMGWVDKNLGNGTCRGMIIAKEISPDLILATERVPGVSLHRYKLSVTLEQVTGLE